MGSSSLACSVGVALNLVAHRRESVPFYNKSIIMVANENHF